jgi:hypothetical protein
MIGAPHKVVLRELDWTRHPKIPNDACFQVILGCDFLDSDPTAKEFAQTAAFTLEPCGTPVHVGPDHGENVGHLKKVLQLGYLMSISSGYLKLGINGECFFPMETGAYDARIQST